MVRPFGTWLLLMFALGCSQQGREQARRTQMPPEASDPGIPATIHIAKAPKPNPYIESVRAQRRLWQGRALRDYVFVVDEGHQIATADMLLMRVVVEGARVASASSLQYGGAAPIEHVPTMDALFDRAEYDATFGEDGVPFRFEARYDAAFGFPIEINGDGREQVADDEQRLRVVCFAEGHEGCRAIPISRAQCRGAGGSIRAAGLGCEAGWSIGLVDTAQVCCRAFNAKGEDDLTPRQCRAVGGSEACGDDTLSVGNRCCRRFFVR